MEIVKVVCAIVEYNDEVLVVQRNENMKLPLKWEFPGGKVESGESEEECIKREIREELNIEINLVSRLSPSLFQYSHMTIQLIPFIACQKGGSLRLSEHKQYRILKRDSLTDLDWAEADIPILKEYLKL
jgi:8-oxo-dGTP diphosphatase